MHAVSSLIIVTLDASDVPNLKEGRNRTTKGQSGRISNDRLALRRPCRTVGATKDSFADAWSAGLAIAYGPAAGLYGFEMNNIPFAVRDDGASGELCRTCQHPLLSHDSISLRWCAATASGVVRQGCICSGIVSSARVLAHY